MKEKKKRLTSVLDRPIAKNENVRTTLKRDSMLNDVSIWPNNL